MVLKRKLESQQLQVMTEVITDSFAGSDKVEIINFSESSELEVDMIVISAGIKPRDELARMAGLEVGKMGGIVVDAHMQTSHPDISR